jgi:hypothetical protein
VKGWRKLPASSFLWKEVRSMHTDIRIRIILRSLWETFRRSRKTLLRNTTILLWSVYLSMENPISGVRIPMWTFSGSYQSIWSRMERSFWPLRTDWDWNTGPDVQRTILELYSKESRDTPKQKGLKLFQEKNLMEFWRKQET